MRFMIMVRATPDTEAGAPPDAGLMAAMADFHEQLAHAGMLVDASGLQPSAQGWRIHYAGERRTVIDGPFAEAKELVAGYTIIRADSREEALEWTRWFPNPMGPGREAIVEVRQLYELDEFEPGEALDRFRELEAARPR
jgi:hypothetical protein